MRRYLVYFLYCRHLRKGYVGKTCGKGTGLEIARRRVAAHIRDAAGDSPLAIHRAIRKYGFDAFDLSVLGIYDTDTEALAAEIRFIAKNKTYINDVNSRGYNMTRGGEGVVGAVFSAEARAKIGAAQRGRRIAPEQRKKMDAGRIGKPLSEERRRKIGDANRGRVRTSAQIEKMREALRKRVVTKATREKLRQLNIGRKHTDETKLKMRGKRRPLSIEHRAKLSSAHKGQKQRPEWVAKRIAATARTKALRRAQ